MTPPSPNPIVQSYDPEAFYDELFSAPGVVRSEFSALAEKLSELVPGELSGRQQAADRALMRMGITFQVYGEESKAEKVFPFDILPRVISANDWEVVDRGLRQRITALNMFSQDVYGEKKIIKDGIIPDWVVYILFGIYGTLRRLETSFGGVVSYQRV